MIKNLYIKIRFLLIIITLCGSNTTFGQEEEARSGAYLTTQLNLDKAPISLALHLMDQKKLGFYAGARMHYFMMSSTYLKQDQITVDYLPLSNKVTRGSITLGVNYNVLKKFVWVYAGAGYGWKTHLDQYNVLENGEIKQPETWFKRPEMSKKGVETEFGLIVDVMGMRVNVGGSAVNFNDLMLTYGIGIKIF